MLSLTPDQLAQLRELTTSNIPTNTSNDLHTITKEITIDQTFSPSIGQKHNQTISSTHTSSLLTHKSFPIIPILSISGLTFISLGGIYLFRPKSVPLVKNSLPISIPSPTQVPKSIQHYLLTSQQYFTQALQLQQNTSVPADERTSELADLLNKSIFTASEAIKIFPSDYRGYEQRGRIYFSITTSQPAVIPNAIADLSKAFELNPTSAEISRSLAALYANSGDRQSTLNYLTKTVNLEPTKAQHFYDLARLQQQTGQLPQAINTYNRLLTIISDPSQKNEVEAEKSALENLISQNPNPSTSQVTPTFTPPSTEGSLIQAFIIPTGLPAGASAAAGLIIAAPEINKDITIRDSSGSNALTGTNTLPAFTKSINISNNNLISSSQVYITIIKGGKNQNLQVISRSGNSFTVGLDSVINENIEFKWWIVN